MTQLIVRSISPLSDECNEITIVVFVLSANAQCETEGSFVPDLLILQTAAKRNTFLDYKDKETQTNTSSMSANLFPVPLLQIR